MCLGTAICQAMQKQGDKFAPRSWRIFSKETSQPRKSVNALAARFMDFPLPRRARR